MRCLQLIETGGSHQLPVVLVLPCSLRIAVESGLVPLINSCRPVPKVLAIPSDSFEPDCGTHTSQEGGRLA